MQADYDSWRDDIERGDGYALGGAGTFRRVRPHKRWRAAIIDRLRLVVFDLTLLVACALAVFLLVVTRALVMLPVTAVIWAFTGLWFRHQRLDHERRPR